MARYLRPPTPSARGAVDLGRIRSAASQTDYPWGLTREEPEGTDGGSASTGRHGHVEEMAPGVPSRIAVGALHAVYRAPQRRSRSNSMNGEVDVRDGLPDD